jgi:7,8-dihydropterin-6-yl-methyl-4-(beta-D-ribofuranosyl)aminobenzene 5'-phosphate synthase
MRTRLTILCENTVNKPVQAIGEHGFACLIETPSGRFLFDTGQGLGILHNAELLQARLEEIDGIILSHGHFDHAGGLLPVLTRCGPKNVYAHPALFTPRYWVGRYERRANGLPFNRSEAEAAGACFLFEPSFHQLAPGIWLSGEVPRLDLTHIGDSALQAEGADGDLHPDPLSDDLSLVLESPRGLVVLTGCAHAGLPNILNHVCTQTGQKRIYAVIGGLHLAPAADDHFMAAVSALQKYRVQRIGVAHCTGSRRAAELLHQFPDAVFFASVGSTFDL